MTSSPPRLQHVVLMRFPDGPTDADLEQVSALVLSFPQHIETLLECRVGADLTGERARGYHVLLYTIFADAAGLAAYVAHPRHQELVRFLDERGCERLAFDYYLDATTDAFLGQAQA